MLLPSSGRWVEVPDTYQTSVNFHQTERNNNAEDNFHCQVSEDDIILRLKLTKFINCKILIFEMEPKHSN